jgi:transcription antitermination factor NusG
MKDNHEGKSLTALKVGDKVKILEVLGSRTGHRHIGSTGVVSEIVDIDRSRIWVTPEGSGYPLALLATEVEKIETKPKLKFKVGDRVAFRLEGWATAEGVVVKAKESEAKYYPYEVKLTIEPGNGFHKAGQISNWRENMLKPAPEESKFKTGDRVVVNEPANWRNLDKKAGTVENIWSRSSYSVVYSVKIDGQSSARLVSEKELTAEPKAKFKVGDKIYVVNTSEGTSFKGKNGTVKSISTEKITGTGEQLYNIQFSDDDHTPLIRESALELQPEVGYKVGDKVRFTANDHWSDGEGVIRGIDFSRGYKDYYKVEITKKPKLNVVYSQGDRVNLTENEIAKVDRLSTDPLEIKDLEDKEIGDVVVDVDGDTWVHIGFGHFAYKGAENELELNTAEALHENYSPLIDWIK